MWVMHSHSGEGRTRGRRGEAMAGRTGDTETDSKSDTATEGRSERYRDKNRRQRERRAACGIRRMITLGHNHDARVKKQSPGTSQGGDEQRRRQGREGYWLVAVWFAVVGLRVRWARHVLPLPYRRRSLGKACLAATVPSGRGARHALPLPYRQGFSRVGASPHQLITRSFGRFRYNGSILRSVKDDAP